jgi:hypothetical protein
MIERAPLGHAVLSQNSRQHLQDLGPAHAPALNEADQHPHILHQE